MKILIHSLWMLLLLWVGVSAGSLRVDLRHHYGDDRLLLNSLRYGADAKYSVTRLSYLLSDFALLDGKGQWVSLADQYAYVDVTKRLTQFHLASVPEGEYRGIRFSIGVPKLVNHADPAQYAPAHPLNPNNNQLHWNWAGGYIFLAIEGRYYTQDKSLKGYVYHLAEDRNLSRVQLSGQFGVKQHTAIQLGFDVQKLLTQPRVLSFDKDGDSTHSKPGDPIASALVTNLQSSFSYEGASYPEGEAPLKKVEPLYLPKNYKPYRFVMSRSFPRPALPRDNPLLEERVRLGRLLFNEPRMSRSLMLSCASCHRQEQAFSDVFPLSSGVEDRKGTRNSMPLFNLAWKSSFFWDGRAESLRQQALMPIMDHVEMDDSLENVVAKISEVVGYQNAFERAFGSKEVSAEKISLALECFMLTLTSFDSKFDRAMAGKAQLSEQEKRGAELFFTENEPRTGQRGADCFHCHGGANFSDHQFHNNGVNSELDLGRYQFTKKDEDKGKFSTPSLRNVALTAPYMHDGRFATLEEVVAHYSGPMKRSATLDPNLAKHPAQGLQLSAEDQAALVAFLRSLTDPKYTGQTDN